MLTGSKMVYNGPSLYCNHYPTAKSKIFTFLWKIWKCCSFCIVWFRLLKLGRFAPHKWNLVAKQLFPLCYSCRHPCFETQNGRHYTSLNTDEKTILSRGGSTLGILRQGCANGNPQHITYNRPSSAEFYYPTLDWSPQISPYPWVTIFQ